jgi:cytochrome c-type biogenesis protein CcmE
MELTPRTGPGPEGDDGAASTGTGAPAPRRPGRRRLPALVLLVLVVGVGGYVLVNALGGATTFYRNVDEAVAQRDTLGTTRFRLQGTVVPGTSQRTGDGVDFMITFNGVEIPVHHTGDPPEMFKENEAVLLEGHFAEDGTDTYRSDLMIVKHSNVYESQNQERLKEAQDGGQVPAGSATPSSEAGGS